MTLPISPAPKSFAATSGGATVPMHVPMPKKNAEPIGAMSVVGKHMQIKPAMQQALPMMTPARTPKRS